MASRTVLGTVIRWDPARGCGVIESPELSGTVWAEAAALHPRTNGHLRAGQVVGLEWAEPGPAGHGYRAVHVVPREDLQSTPGG